MNGAYQIFPEKRCRLMSDSAASGMDIKKIAQGTFFIFSITFFGLGLNYLYGIFLARWLGAERFGLYALGLSVFNLLASISLMGLDNAALRFIPGVSIAGHVPSVKNMIRNILKLGCLTGAGAAILLAVFGPYLSNGLYKTRDLEPVFLAFAVAIPAYVCSSTLLSILQALQNVRWRMFVKYVSEPVARFILTTILLLLGLALKAALIGFIVALWGSVVFGYVGLTLIMKEIGTRMDPVGHSEPGKPDLMGYVLPLLFGLLFGAVASRSDVLLLGYFNGARDTGMYAASLMTAAIIAIILQSLESFMAPLLSESLALGIRKNTQDIFSFSLRWGVLLGFPLLFCFCLFSREILGFYGEAFQSAALCLVLLTVGQFINIATGSANSILLFSGKSKVVMINELFKSILQIVLNILLIPMYGITGAAISMLVALTAINVLRLIEVYKMLGIHPYERELMKPVVAASTISLLIILGKEWIPGNAALVMIPVGTGLYFLLLVLMGLKDQDKKAVEAIFRRVSI